MEKPSYVYGTMHVSNRVAYYLSEQFFSAIESADIVGLETHPGEWLENMKKTGELDELTRVREPQGDRNFYKSAFAVAFPEKRIFQSILSYDPDIINGLLYRQNKSNEDFEESTYIDLFIFQTASKLGKHVIGLEDLVTSEIKSRLSALPDEETNSAKQKFSAYRHAQKLEDAYREGDLDMIDSLSRLATSKNMQKYLISDRNQLFVQTMDSVMKQNSIFCGVGAAHLPGTEGVIELLRKKGYKVEPVEADVTKKSNNQREKLDQIVSPVQLQTIYSEDSLFSVDLPGKLYPIFDAGQLKYYIHADMVNGSFYTVVRLKHFGPLFGISAAQVYNKVDSLLFEYIPGRILERTELTTPSGIRGIEVLNRTRGGDEQHYQIYFTSGEMVMFKLGGKRSYASSEVAEKFFSSVRFIAPDSGNTIFSPPSGGFTLSLPANYTYDKSGYTGVAGQAENVSAIFGNAVYGLRHAVYNDFNYLEEDTFELNQLASGVLNAYGYDESATTRIASGETFPAIYLNGKNKNGKWLHGKILICGVHYYLQYHTSSDSLGVDKEFFAGLHLGAFIHVHPIKEISDDEFGFKALDEVTDDARSRFNELYQKAYNAVKNDSSSEKTAAATGYKAGSKMYYSPSSNEYVSINYERYSPYDYRNPETIDEKIEGIFSANTTMFISRKSSKNENGLRELRYTLSDTGTVRALEVRIIFARNTMHELTAACDTTLGLQGWTKKFFESFTPVDSATGKNIFENDFDELVSDLKSSDTIRSQAANRALQQGLIMQKPFASRYIKLLKSNDLWKISEDSRAQLFVNGGTMQHNGVVGPYKELYMQYTDSFYLQLCILKGLAYLKTPESYAAFAELVVTEPPLIGDENSVNDVLAVLRDSLELCRNFFPALHALTRYEEYRQPVYALLADLLRNDLIGTGKYAKQKDLILTDAGLALKRYNPALKNGAEERNFSHLDKASAEHAENLRKNLDGLVRNMLRAASTENAYVSEDRHPLINYAIVLAPFYKKDARVEEFFTKLSRVKEQEIQLPLTVALLRNNVRLSDTIVRHYSSNIFTRAYFYSELERLEITSKFDKDFLSQKQLVESFVAAQKRLNTYYGYDQHSGDSLTLVDVLPASNKYQQGRLYVFTSGKQAGREQWSAVFVDDRYKKATSKMEVLSSGYYTDAEKSRQENLNDLLGYFRLSYRKRALVNTGV